MSELQPLYQLDILGTGYEQATLNFPDDYEGKVVATLIRKKAAQPTKKAVLYIHGFIDYFFRPKWQSALISMVLIFMRWI